MAKVTKQDMRCDTEPDYLVHPWLPIGDRILVAGTQGCSKTWILLWLCVCVAAGKKFFGRPVMQGPVLIVDEETPTHVIVERLNRYCLSMGYQSYKELPIEILSHEGVRWGLTNRVLYNMLKVQQPSYVSMESFIAMTPSGQKGKHENDSGLGALVRDDMLAIMKHASTVSLSCHTSKKFCEQGLLIDEINDSEVTMQSLVSGSPHLVGQACDTGLYIHKISEPPNPLRFAIVTKMRRSAVRVKEVVYVELKEDSFGQDEAWLEQISPLSLPPSEEAKQLYSLLGDPANLTGANWVAVPTRKIANELYLFNKGQIIRGVNELLHHKVIVNGDKPQCYKISRQYLTRCDPDYLAELRK